MNEEDSGSMEIGRGYARFQMAKALTALDEADGTAEREQALKKLAKWEKAIHGMLSGEVRVGSRTPVDAPAWATLEVVTGGFATGELLAGGEILDHERHLAARLAADATEMDYRIALNSYFLSEPGVAELNEWLAAGRYDIEVPEEGALLTVAWLLRHGHGAAAREIVTAIAPHFSDLRFYPRPSDSPRRFGSRVSLLDAGAVVKQLERIQPKLQVVAQREAIEVWAPFTDRLVSLFLETVDGDAPNLETDPDGRRIAIGGWPCCVHPDGWRTRAMEAMEDFPKLREKHRHCGKPDRAKENLPQLLRYLSFYLSDPESLSKKDVGKIRFILASCIAKRGVPGSAQHRSLREAQNNNACQPLYSDIAQKILAPRLAKRPPNEGVDDVAEILAPAGGSDDASVPQGTRIPTHLAKRVERCLRQSISELVERGIITSGDTLAIVLPQMTSVLRAAAIGEPMLRDLYTAIYCAFRQRRSLLLLNLQKQVQIEELPWVSALDQFRREKLSAKALSREAMVEVTSLAMTAFPQAILPNKLLQELGALSKSAGIKLPLVEEIAADIFMGTFSPKFLEAARIAADLLVGTPYERYYGIEFDAVTQLARKSARRFGILRSPQLGTKDSFAKICQHLAGTKGGSWGGVVENGMVLEQQQIVTTQNLATVFSGLSLREPLAPFLEDMAWRCFVWVCKRLQVNTDSGHAELIALKNSAYAWRQMLFYLSVAPDPGEALRRFLARAKGHVSEQDAVFANRFAPALAGLDAVVADRAIPPDDPECRRFLGWVDRRHWLLPPADP